MIHTCRFIIILVSENVICTLIFLTTSICFVAGGSVIKLAYLSIEDWKKDQKEVRNISVAQLLDLKSWRQSSRLYISKLLVYLHLFQDTVNHNGKLRLTSFAREQLDECFDFIKENCFIRRKSEDDKPLMYTCGIGGFQYGKKIEDSLNVRCVLSVSSLFLLTQSRLWKGKYLGSQMANS